MSRLAIVIVSYFELINMSYARIICNLAFFKQLVYIEESKS